MEYGGGLGPQLKRHRGKAESPETGMVRDAAADDVVLRKRLLYVFKRFATTIGVDIVS